MNQKLRDSLLLFTILALNTLFTPKLLEVGQNIFTQLEDLLPQNLPSIQTYQIARKNLKNYAHLKILIETKTPDQTEHFIESFVHNIRQEIRTDRIHYRFEDLKKYFETYKAYYIPLDHYKQNFEKDKKINNFKGLFSYLKKSFEISNENSKYFFSQKVLNFSHGFISNKERNRYLIVLYPDNLTDAQSVSHFIQKIDNVYSNTIASFQSLSQTKFFDGSLNSFYLENIHLKKEIFLSLAVASFTLFFVLLIFFRKISVVFAILSSTFLGTYLAFGIVSQFIQGISINTAFGSCFIIGNGINTGIYYASYWYKNKTLKLNFNFVKTTLLSALCAGFCYFSFIITKFDTLDTFAFLGLLGMILCWFTNLFVFPALIRLANIKPLEGPLYSVRLPQISRYFYITVLVILGTLSIAILRKNNNVFQIENNLFNLRSKIFSEESYKAIREKADKLYPPYFSPPVVLLNHGSLDLAQELHLITQDKRLNDLFSFNIFNYSDLLPDYVNEKQEYIHRFQSNKYEIRSKILKEALENNHISSPPNLDDLPASIKDHLSLKNGELGKVGFINISADTFAKNLSNGEKFIHRLRTLLKGKSIYLFGEYIFWIDLNHILKLSLEQAIYFCIAISVLLILLLAPGLKLTLLSLGTLTLTVLSYLAAIQVLGLKISFINFLAIPMTIGIGVDYMINFSQANHGKLFSSGAVFAASLSTLIGYGSLLLSDSLAIQSLGKLTFLGEIITLVIAFMAHKIYQKI